MEKILLNRNEIEILNLIIKKIMNDAINKSMSFFIKEELQILNKHIFSFEHCCRQILEIEITNDEKIDLLNFINNTNMEIEKERAKLLYESYSGREKTEKHGSYFKQLMDYQEYKNNFIEPAKYLNKDNEFVGRYMWLSDEVKNGREIYKGIITFSKPIFNVLDNIALVYHNYNFGFSGSGSLDIYRLINSEWKYWFFLDSWR